MSEEVLPLRERKRLRTRRHIEEAALRLFLERGYERTTVADIAAAAEVGERTFFAHFASKEDVVLGDIGEEMMSMRAALTERPPDATLLQVLRRLGDRRIALFVERNQQVLARRAVEQANPGVHARAVALREKAEHAMLTPEFARDLRLPPDHPNVALMVAAFTGISGALDALFETSTDPAASRAVLDTALTALESLQTTLRSGRPELSPSPSADTDP